MRLRFSFFNNLTIRNKTRQVRGPMICQLAVSHLQKRDWDARKLDKSTLEAGKAASRPQNSPGRKKTTIA